MTATPPTTPPTIAPMGVDLELEVVEPSEAGVPVGGGLVGRALVPEALIPGTLVEAEPAGGEFTLFESALESSSLKINNRRIPRHVLEKVHVRVRIRRTCMSDRDGMRSVSQAGLAPSEHLRELKSLIRIPQFVSRKNDTPRFQSRLQC